MFTANEIKMLTAAGFDISTDKQMAAKDSVRIFAADPDPEMNDFETRVYCVTHHVDGDNIADLAAAITFADHLANLD